MRLALVDGSNMVMRASFGGAVAPIDSTPIATGLIRRAANRAGATHLIVAMDAAGASWRRERYPDYKAHRETDTAPWIDYATTAWRELGWCVQSLAGFEADDVIAALAERGLRRAGVIIVSGDSDLLQLLPSADEPDRCGLAVMRPVNGGDYEWMNTGAVCEKYGVARPSRLRDLKALAGERGDNVPGVPGIGPKRATDLLAEYGGIESIIAHAQCKNGMKVREHEATVRLAYELVGLRMDAPVPAIKPSECGYR